jgi:hypothetical protein
LTSAGKIFLFPVRFAPTALAGRTGVALFFFLKNDMSNPPITGK